MFLPPPPHPADHRIFVRPLGQPLRPRGQPPEERSCSLQWSEPRANNYSRIWKCAMAHLKIRQLSLNLPCSLSCSLYAYTAPLAAYLAHPQPVLLIMQPNLLLLQLSCSSFSLSCSSCSLPCSICSLSCSSYGLFFSSCYISCSSYGLYFSSCYIYYCSSYWRAQRRNFLSSCIHVFNLRSYHPRLTPFYAYIQLVQRKELSHAVLYWNKIFLWQNLSSTSGEPEFVAQ